MLVMWEQHMVRAPSTQCLAQSRCLINIVQLNILTEFSVLIKPHSRVQTPVE